MELSLPYSDPLQISETLNEMGQLTRITQFDSGAGNYSMTHSMASGISIAEIKASKTLLYEGWGTDWSVDFNWITPLKNSLAPMGICEGYEMKANSLGGLNTYNGSKGGSWGKYSPLCSSTACMLDKASLMEAMIACNAQVGIENLTSNKGLEVSDQLSHQLKRLARKDLQAGISNPSKYYDLIICCLEDGKPRAYKKGETKNHALLSEIVRLSHDTTKMSSPMTLADVCHFLNTGQASLYRVCQKYFGMGIIEMMMQVRLEESRRALLRYQDQSAAEESMIREVAIQYGFKHAGRYARRYFNSFGELPSQTLLNA
ncbi:AraC-type transcriptional regulator involved in type IV chromatic acclimation [Synechococcus sp. MIT S9220]|uniref:helix-turn-helix domain-containing protein n=1 Tax=unclassified Synechococcus TaxID=2626047 RepID=UPI000D0BFC83|nr:helix-turn-helix domain-containing protein [Synechococcus sp. MIT S9220]AVH76660.1 putative AraC-type helix-turn-helix DNA-binding domain-containing transcriptional regulator [Synechococcus sp. MIT S9220]NOL46525.1 AraC family transcriptional regulator [Synechococcus sp. MIT S9220]QNJ23361.1 AraC-type transcriptional regulator involved in type IV chromatic acclimation [Synechococcus sp. MIT S9220]|tara:strand:+ start:1139 stop:2086 length:948 start_codon:yes stop_codon:yes gene_type:complete